MKLSYVLPFVAASSAFVIPSEQVLDEVDIEKNHRGWLDEVAKEKDRIVSDAGWYFEELKEESKDYWNQATEYSRNALDDAFETAGDAAETVNDKVHDAATGAQSWLESELDDVYDAFEEDSDDHPPHHRPGHGHRPKHPHKGKPNETVYQIIAGSKYSTKLAKLINEFDDLVEALNSTKANYTVFAPTDKALDKIPKHAPKPSKEQLKEFLSYHVVPDYAPAKKVLTTHTFPTLLKSDSLGKEPLPQRLTPRLSWRGPTINWYARIFALNIYAENGVIHAIDTPLFPPPSGIKIIDLFPSGYSTLELGLSKTGLLDKLNTTDHAGGTFFTPTNHAFAKLGPKVNAFLFSQYGLKYLKALLEYHIVPDNTLYSDAYYKAESSEVNAETGSNGVFHVDLPTLLKDRKLAVDIARYGPFISMKVNAFASVSVQDIVAEDGVLHAMKDVIVPPKKLGGGEEQYWEGGEMSVDELVERLEPFVAKEDL